MLQNGLTEYETLLKIKAMNRKQKRTLAKKLGMSYSDLIESLNFQIVDMQVDQIPEGTKVKLNYDRIMEHKDELSEKYIKWVTEHKNDIFTVEFDPLKKEKQTADYNSFVQFVEDETKPKWLFWAGDLIPVEGQTRPVTDKEKLVKEFNEKIDSILSKME